MKQRIQDLAHLYTEKVIAIRREDQSVWERRAPLGNNILFKIIFICKLNPFYFF